MHTRVFQWYFYDFFRLLTLHHRCHCYLLIFFVAMVFKLEECYWRSRVFACVCVYPSPSTRSSKTMPKHIIQKTAWAIFLVYPRTKIFMILSWQFFFLHAQRQLQVTSSNSIIMFLLLLPLLHSNQSFSGLRCSASSFHFLICFFILFSFYLVLYWIERWACSSNTK